MRAGKQALITAGFAILGATRAHAVLAPVFRGRGAILTMHHVRPWDGRAFAPNRLLEIEPAFLDAALARVKALGFALVTLDEAVRRLGDGGDRRSFVALTFDDGYRDTLVHALPVLERHGAPFTVFVTPGFAERTARLWWVELEEAVGRSNSLHLDFDGAPPRLPARTLAEKQAAFAALYWYLRGGPEDRLRAGVAALAAAADVSARALVERLCLDWDGIRVLARHPLCTIGVHTLTHPMLAKHGADVVRHEIAESRRATEIAVGLPARHLAYPVGDPGSAGPREFGIAAALGFASAVTTRPGMLFPGHAAHRCALPRVSLNGHWQRLDALDVMLSGVPFALWNKGRRLNVGAGRVTGRPLAPSSGSAA